MSRRRRIIKTARLGGQTVVVQARAAGEATAPEEAPQAPPVATVQELEAQARARALATVSEARQQAEELLNQAREQAAAVRLQAYQEGYNEGREEGLEEARREMEETLALVRTAAREAKQIRDRIILNSERQVIELVLDVVRKLMATELDQNPKVVVETVERAIKRAGSQRIVRIRVSPEDRETVSVAFPEGTGDWDVVPDGSVSLGGCIIDTESGTIDARLEAQLAEVEQALTEMTDER